MGGEMRPLGVSTVADTVNIVVADRRSGWAQSELTVVVVPAIMMYPVLQ